MCDNININQSINMVRFHIFSSDCKATMASGVPCLCPAPKIVGPSTPVAWNSRVAWRCLPVREHHLSAGWRFGTFFSK